MHSMRFGTVPHSCVFCENQNTFSEYLIGVTNAKGESYTLTFPDSLQHYLNPNPKHPWKENYHPPGWFINDLLDLGTRFSFPPGGRQLAQKRSVGYLTSLAAMQEQYKGFDNLPAGAQRCIRAKTYAMDAILDSHGTDDNIGRPTLSAYQDQWLADFKPEPLPARLIKNLGKLMGHAYISFQLDFSIEKCCLVRFNSSPDDRESEASLFTSKKPLYDLHYDTKTAAWFLTCYESPAVHTNVAIGSVRGLAELLSAIRDGIVSVSVEHGLTTCIQRHHFSSHFPALIPRKDFNPVTNQYELRLEGSEVKPEVVADVVATVAIEAKADAKGEAKVEAKPDAEGEAKVEAKADAKVEVKQVKLSPPPLLSERLFSSWSFTEDEISFGPGSGMSQADFEGDDKKKDQGKAKGDGNVKKPGY